MKKINKIVCLMVLFAICLSVCNAFCFEVHADQDQTSAKAMIVIEEKTGRVLCEKNSEDRLAMASTTKIMTALTVLKNCVNVDEEVAVSNDAIGIEGTSMYLKKGEKLTVKELLYGLILPSGNDAAVALACHISKTENEFVKKMNELAKEIGLKNTSFANAHGLDADGHFTSAHDLAIITKEALKNPVFLEISKTKNVKVKGSAEGEFRFLKNKNKLLFSSDDCIGVKTGFTDKAGRCFVAAFEKDGMTLISVVLNCGPMFEDSEKIVNSCFEKYSMKEIVKPYSIVDILPVSDGEMSNVKAFVFNGFSYPLTQEEYKKLDIRKIIPENLFAPIEKEEIIGDMEIYLENQLLFSQKIYTMNKVKSVNFKDKLSEILENWNI